MEQGAVLAGRYALSGFLGRGGMADVHRAHDLRLDRDVAVKVLRAGQAGDAAFRGRFRREALSAASLGHPGIVAVFDTGEAVVDGVEVPYIVMEYVEGRTLSDLVHDGPGPSVEESLRLTAGVLDALRHAHEHGIVHRDIKPANVMLSDRDGVKVMDFGIARPVGVSGMTVTATSMVVGTAEYLSPEQARGLPVDARCDLYSTGCLLYELLTGRPPFTADSALAVAWKHVDEEPLPPSAHAPGVPPACDAVVLKALRKDREERYRDAAEMIAALDAALRAPLEPLPPAPATVESRVTPEERPRRSGTRRGRRAGAVAAVMVAAVAVLAGWYATHPGAPAGGGPAGATATATVVAPDLRGQSVTQARKSAQSAHLRVAGVRLGACAPLAAERQVCGQQPAPGSRVRQGTGISLQVSPRSPRQH